MKDMHALLLVVAAICSCATAAPLTFDNIQKVNAQPSLILFHAGGFWPPKGNAKAQKLMTLFETGAKTLEQKCGCKLYTINLKAEGDHLLIQSEIEQSFLKKGSKLAGYGIQGLPTIAFHWGKENNKNVYLYHKSAQLSSAAPNKDDLMKWTALVKNPVSSGIKADLVIDWTANPKPKKKNGPKTFGEALANVAKTVNNQPKDASKVENKDITKINGPKFGAKLPLILALLVGGGIGFGVKKFVVDKNKNPTSVEGPATTPAHTPVPLASIRNPANLTSKLKFKTTGPTAGKKTTVVEAVKKLKRATKAKPYTQLTYNSKPAKCIKLVTKNGPAGKPATYTAWIIINK